MTAMTYPLLRQLIEEGAVTLLSLGLVEKVSGVAAASGGDWESSKRHFEAALALQPKVEASDGHLPPYLALMLLT